VVSPRHMTSKERFQEVAFDSPPTPRNTRSGSSSMAEVSRGSR
jgi:hypothetical protein